jgi:hypothetical protein
MRQLCYQAWVVKPRMLAQSKKWWPYLSEDTRQAMIDIICKAFQGDPCAKQRAVTFFNLGSLHFKLKNEVAWWTISCVTEVLSTEYPPMIGLCTLIFDLTLSFLFFFF